MTSYLRRMRKRPHDTRNRKMTTTAGMTSSVEAARQTPAAYEPFLVAEGLAKSFSGVPALRDGKLVLKRGTVHALCGGNGAGKSTFLNILMGLLCRDEGVVRVG